MEKKEYVKQISIFDANKYNERFSTIGSPMNESQKIEAREVHKKVDPADKLMETLSTGIIHDVRATVDDLLSLVYSEVFNKEWAKHNYILRNVNIVKSVDSGNSAIRSAAHIELNIDHEYTKEMLKTVVVDFIDRLIQNNEYTACRELVRQFKAIIRLDMSNQYEDYQAALRNTSDQRLLQYFMSLSPEELKGGISVEVNGPWDWLKFGPYKILTEHFVNGENTTYQGHIINKVSFLFDNNFIAKTLDNVKYIYDTNKQGGIDEYVDYKEFNTICNRKRARE